MGRSLLLQTQRLCTLCDLNKVEDEFYFLMSCPNMRMNNATFLTIIHQDFPSVAHLQLRDQFITVVQRLWRFPRVADFVHKLLNCPSHQGALQFNTTPNHNT